MTTIESALSKTDLEFIRDFILTRSAIVIGKDKDYLIVSRLETLAHQESMTSLESIVSALRSSPNSPLAAKVVDAMTTNETSFFRDLHPFHILRDTLLPEMMTKRQSKRAIQIWSAASSTGQEAYSIALTIKEHFSQLAGWNIKILGTDISEKVLAQARRGTYSQIEVNRGLPAPLLLKHFGKSGASWTIDDSLKSMVEFNALNLVKPWIRIPPVDIVFLRNVLIYFDAKTKASIIKNVHKILRPDGYLLLGSSETAIGLDIPFDRKNHGRCGVYLPHS